MAFRLPRLRDEQIVDGKPATFLFRRWWESVVKKIEDAITSIEAILDTLTGVSGSLTGIQAQADILDNLASVSGTGLLEKTGASAVDVRTIGVASAGSIPTRNDADGRYNRIGQGLYTNTRTVTASGAVASNDSLILANATAGAITMSLPAAAGATGQIVNIKKTDASANAVTIDPDGAETIDGAATLSFSTQYQSYTVQCDGSQWWII